MLFFFFFYDEEYNRNLFLLSFIILLLNRGFTLKVIELGSTCILKFKFGWNFLTHQKLPQFNKQFYLEAHSFLFNCGFMKRWWEGEEGWCKYPVCDNLYLVLASFSWL